MKKYTYTSEVHGTTAISIYSNEDFERVKNPPNKSDKVYRAYTRMKKKLCRFPNCECTYKMEAPQ